jgi:hypothetical protein
MTASMQHAAAIAAFTLVGILMVWRLAQSLRGAPRLERNAAGDVVGPLRQCHNADGRPKIVYRDEAAAKTSGMRAYRCDFGHWHVTSKKERAPVRGRARV